MLFHGYFVIKLSILIRVVVFFVWNFSLFSSSCSCWSACLGYLEYVLSMSLLESYWLLLNHFCSFHVTYVIIFFFKFIGTDWFFILGWPTTDTRSCPILYWLTPEWNSWHRRSRNVFILPSRFCSRWTLCSTEGECISRETWPTWMSVLYEDRRL
jgi:hypothetical protein